MKIPKDKLETIAVVVFVIGLLLTHTCSAQAAITVTSLNDSGPGSLRQAIADAAPGDTISFAVTGTITLTSGELLVDKNMTILGPGPVNLALDGIAFSRVLHIINGAGVAISGLTITNGFASGPGGGIYNDRASLTVSNITCNGNAAYTWGGGIYSDGTISLRNCSVSGNTAQYGGAGIFLTGSDDSITLLIDQSVISSNSANIGAGILAVGRSPVQIRNSIVNGNSSKGYGGGGIYNDHGSVTLSNCTVQGNSAIQWGAGIYNDAGNFSIGSAMLKIIASSISSNYSGLHGSGIYTLAYRGSATVEIDTSTIVGNSANSYYGGGIMNDASYYGTGTVEIVNSTIRNNSAGGAGGGIWSRAYDTGAMAVLTVKGSTISDNASSYGGGIWSAAGLNTTGSVEIVNSTLSGNTAFSGGGIHNGGDGGSAVLVVSASTITSNTASGGNGGGIYSLPGTMIAAKNTILAGNQGTSKPDCDGILNSADFNFIGNTNGATIIGATTHNIYNQDPLLGPLADNGGPTWTHALLTGSPAIGAGDPSFTPPPDFDQRGPGFPRVVSGRIDIGAVEYAYVCPGDADCDGIPDSWMYQYFGHATGQAADKSRATDDADGDGQSNLAEFQAGTSPTNGASAFRIVEIAPLDEDMLLSWTAVGGKRYVLQTTSGDNGNYSNNFMDLNPAIIAPGTGETEVTVLHLGGATKSTSGFYRVRLVP